MTDKFEGMPETLQSPASSGFAITPHDTNDLAITPRGFSVGADGTVTVNYIDNGTNIQLYCLAGIVYGRRVSRVYATGTTATGIVGEY